MDILILYWIFSSFWAMGLDFYCEERITIKSVLVSIFFGWVLLPVSLGTKRGKDLDEKN